MSNRSLRVIAGKHKNQIIYAPVKFSSSPMGERQRQAIFNSITNLIPNSVFLDAFSGTGSVGIEAISRGAGRVCFVEKDYSTYKQLLKNIASLNIGTNRSNIFRCSVHSFVRKFGDYRFNIILADPPYTNFKIEQIEELTTLLEDDGLLIVSSPISEEMPETINKLSLISQKNIAGARISFYR